MFDVKREPIYFGSLFVFQAFKFSSLKIFPFCIGNTGTALPGSSSLLAVLSLLKLRKGSNMAYSYNVDKTVRVHIVSKDRYFTEYRCNKCGLWVTEKDVQWGNLPTDSNNSDKGSSVVYCLKCLERA